MLFFLDWDDTLFPTRFVCECHFHDFLKKYNDIRTLTPNHLNEYLSTHCSTETLEQWKIYTSTVETILRYCVSIGDVYIITNSINGWANLTFRLTFPELMLLNIPIISARDRFPLSPEPKIKIFN